MSHYLSHLADLTQNRLDTIQPRLASRFELTENTAAADLTEPEIAATTSAKTDNSQPENSTPLTAKPATTSPLLAEPPLSIIRANESATQSVSPQSFVSTENQPSANEIVLLTSPPAIQPLQQKSVAPAAINEPAAPTKKDVDISVETIKTPPQSNAIEPPALAIKPANITIRPAQSETPSALANLGWQSSPAIETTPTPTIQVSIGRIEIRANQTTNTTPAKPRASNTQSLDDYLKQRNGERR
jgi:hypothetical protein